MRRELSPATMLSRLPLAILPGGLRARTVQLVADLSPGALTYRARVVHNARLMGPAGFPVQLTTPSVPRWQGSYVLAAFAAVAALILLGGGMFFVDYSSNHAAAPTHTATPGATGSRRSLALAPKVKGSTPAPAPAPAVTVTVTAGGSVPTSAKASVKAPPPSTKKSATSPPPSTKKPPPTTPPPPTPQPPPTTPPPTPPPPTTPPASTAAGAVSLLGTVLVRLL